MPTGALTGGFKKHLADLVRTVIKKPHRQKHLAAALMPVLFIALQPVTQSDWLDSPFGDGAETEKDILGRSGQFQPVPGMDRHRLALYRDRLDGDWSVCRIKTSAYLHRLEYLSSRRLALTDTLVH